MSKVAITKQKIIDVADALREKTGTAETYTLDEIPQAISGIQTGAEFTISDASYLFYKGARLEAKDELLSAMQNVTDMKHMFYNSGITEIDTSKFDTSLVKDMNGMFGYCNLNEIDLSTFNTSNVTDMGYMFAGCRFSEIDLSTFDTGKVTTVSNMFKSCAIKNIDLSNLNLLNVTDISSLFADCASLTSVNLSGVTIPNLVSMGSLFYYCTKLTGRVDFSGIDTRKTTTISSLFSYARSVEEIIGFSAANKAGFSLGLPTGTASSSRAALRRLTFRTDYPEGVYAIRSAIDIKYCSFDRDGMVEMFNTLPDITGISISSSYKKITITGNPCVTDGTLTDEDKAIATNKGWTLVA